MSGQSTIRAAMVLAAGLGTRMQPLTAGTAKPLLTVAGRTLLDYALDRLAEAGIVRAVVNTHWHGDQVADRLRARAAREADRLQLVQQPEAELLGTGGAIAQALRSGALRDGAPAGAVVEGGSPETGAATDNAAAPFVAVNGDSLWLDGPIPALARLVRRFDDASLDALLLVARTATVVGQVGSGDFAIDENGVLRRRGENEIVPYVFAGVQLLSPRLFEQAPEAPFSMNLLWDRAIESGRIAALVHDGPWFHLSRPADIAEAERAIRDPMFGPSNT